MHKMAYCYFSVVFYVNKFIKIAASYFKKKFFSFRYNINSNKKIGAVKNNVGGDL